MLSRQTGGWRLPQEHLIVSEAWGEAPQSNTSNKKWHKVDNKTLEAQITLCRRFFIRAHKNMLQRNG